MPESLLRTNPDKYARNFLPDWETLYIKINARLTNNMMEYYDMNWKKQRQKLSGWPAQICQHELDHLEGILI